MSATIVRLEKDEGGKKWPITCMLSQRDPSKDNFLNLKVFAEAPAEVATSLEKEGGSKSSSIWVKNFKWLQTKVQEIIERSYTREIEIQARIPSRSARAIGLVKPDVEIYGQSVNNRVFALDGRVNFSATLHMAEVALNIFEKAAKD